MKLNLSTITIGAGMALFAVSAAGQVALNNATIRSDGPTGSPWFHNAQVAGDFASYGISTFDPDAMGEGAVPSFSTFEISYTQSNAGFTTSGPVEFFITFDQTVAGGDYSALTHDGSASGIDDSQFSDSPSQQSLGTGTFTEVESGTVDTYSLDISAVEAQLIEAFEQGTPFSIILAAPGSEGAVTYAGIQNNSYPNSIILNAVVASGETGLPWEADGLEVGDIVDSPWFGTFAFSADGWVNHNELGWLWTGYVESSESMWFYSLYWDTWLWSSESLFPTVYATGSNAWLYYIIVEDLGALVFNYATYTWSLNP